MGEKVSQNSQQSQVNMPMIIRFSWYQAFAFCKKRHAQLPSEVELEYAIGGLGAVNKQTSQTDSSPSYTNWIGISRDFHWEWTNTIYDLKRFPYPYHADDGREDVSNVDGWNLKDNLRVQIGHSPPSAIDMLQISTPEKLAAILNGTVELDRFPAEPHSYYSVLSNPETVGFRCVYDFSTISGSK